MREQSRIFVISALMSLGILVLCFADKVYADEVIAVINAGFEEPAIGEGGYRDSGITGWEVVGGDGGYGGVYNPYMEDYLWPPEGNNVFLLSNGKLAQSIDTIIEAGVIYRLEVKVGTYAGLPSQYSLSIKTGETVLATLQGNSVTNSWFESVVLQYIPTQGDGGIGNVFHIELVDLETEDENATYFDDVRLSILTDCNGNGVPDIDEEGDSDGDGVLDICDVCPGFDDGLDSDGDGVPDGCDVCPGFDDGLDSDGDGVPDGCDVCPGFDDGLDSDGNGIPDGCDVQRVHNVTQDMWYHGIQEAIDAANASGDEITVEPGTYMESIDFLGKGIYLHSSSGDPNDTIIDGTGHYHVVQCVNREDSNTVLEGFTITGGNAIGLLEDGYGGGMYNWGASSPSVNNCIFKDNSARSAGGGICNYGYCRPRIFNCTFTNNVSDHRGGGMVNIESSHPNVINCTFSGNSVQQEGGGMYNDTDSSPTVTNSSFIGNSANYGGGMYNMTGSNPIVTECLFSENSANQSGGGMYNKTGSNPTVTKCTFSGNSAVFTGGGMYNFASNPTVSQCLFQWNESLSGAAIFNYSGTPKISDSLIESNIASSTGGGILNDNCSAIIIGCRFINNSANGGGGIYNRSGSHAFIANCLLLKNESDLIGGGGLVNHLNSHPLIYFCTIVGNTNNVTNGAGIRNDGGSNPTITSCIIWGNVSDPTGIIGGPFTNAEDQIKNEGNSKPIMTYSNMQGLLIKDFGNISRDPLFIDPVIDNYRLAESSPCIDAADTTVLTQAMALDIDFNPRGVNDPAVQDSGISVLISLIGLDAIADMGAYEYQPIPEFDPCDSLDQADFNCDGVVDLEDFAYFASVWMQRRIISPGEK